MRNLFENNMAEVTPQEALDYGDKMVAVLAELPENERYEFVKLGDGRTGVIVQKEG